MGWYSAVWPLVPLEVTERRKKETRLLAVL
jgi:hypothetical protein